MGTGQDDRRPRWRGAALALVASTCAALALSATPAGAACAGLSMEEGLAAADVVVVGQVVHVTEFGTWATIDVHEIWRGTDRAEVADGLEAHGGPERPEGGEGFVTAGETRTYKEGTRYLVAASRSRMWGGEDGALEDSACSATTEWDAALARYRPDDAVVLGLGEDALQPADDEGGAAGDDGWSPTPRTWGFIIAGLATALFVLDRVGRTLGNRKLRRDHERATGAGGGDATHGQDAGHGDA